MAKEGPRGEVTPGLPRTVTPIFHPSPRLTRGPGHLPPAHHPTLWPNAGQAPSWGPNTRTCHHLGRGHLRTVQSGAPTHQKVTLNTHTLTHVHPHSLPLTHIHTHTHTLSHTLSRSWEGVLLSARTPMRAGWQVRARGKESHGRSGREGDVAWRPAEAPGLSGATRRVTRGGPHGAPPRDERNLPAGPSTGGHACSALSPLLSIWLSRNRGAYVHLSHRPTKGWEQSRAGREPPAHCRDGAGRRGGLGRGRPTLPAEASSGAEPTGVRGNRMINLSFPGGNLSPLSGGKGRGRDGHQVPDCTARAGRV